MSGLDWMDSAACAQVGGDIWHPAKASNTATAKKVCRRCPVTAECLQHALNLDEQLGVWAGTTPTARARLRRDRLVAA